MKRPTKIDNRLPSCTRSGDLFAKESIRHPLVGESLRNLSAPAGRLPGEVLEKILEMRCPEQDLIRASHVCRRWRAALVSSPRLWTKVQCVDVARTLQYLARSERVPINMMADS